MKCRNPEEMHFCHLFGKELEWWRCVEIQEVREDNMDMELSIETFDLEKSNIICEECKWYDVRLWD